VIATGKSSARAASTLLLAAFAALGVAAGAADAVFEPPDEALLPQGRFVYERNCVMCHGRWGDGDGEMGRTVIPKPRKFRTGIFKYRSTPPEFLPKTDDLVRTVRNGRANTAMPFFSHLSDREIRAVVEYVKSFSPKWRKPANHAAPVELPPAPAWIEDARDGAPHIERGAAVFTAVCAACHGTSGDGRGPAAAELRDAWDDPCPPVDLRLAAYRNGRTAPDICRVLTLGISGTPMPSFQEAFTADQRWELAAYLLTLKLPPPAASPARDGAGK
jgi:cytochrome c oxidase cbb3-type subunit 2